MAPKQVSPNHSAMPTFPEGINLMKNLDLILVLASGSSLGQAIPTTVESQGSGL